MASISKFFVLTALALLSSCGKDGPAPSLGCSKCRVFLTAATFDGNMNGVTGADDLCMADANKPADGEYMANLTDFTNRAFDIEWVFRPNTPYYRPDGTLIGTTGSDGLLVLPLTNAISTVNATVWTGGSPNCNFWSSASGASSSFAGTSNSTTTPTTGIFQACSTMSRLYCVEQ